MWRSMKVGIDVSQAVYGTGVSDYTVELVRHLQPLAEIVPVGFSLRRGQELKRLIPDLVLYPIPPTALHYLWNRLHVVNFENFAPGSIDIYHSSDWAQGPDSSAKVTTVHDLSPFLYPAETSTSIVAVHSSRMKWVVKECQHVICVSQNTASDFQKLFKFPVSKISIVPEALPSRFDIPPSPSSLHDVPYILAIGARQPRKNIDRLISAYLNFNSKYRLTEKLIIIGEKPDIRQKEYRGVEYTGYVSDQELVDYISQACAFVYPSLYEGFGLPVLVAFRHAVPVACSRTSSLPEAAGLAASYFDPFDEESIASGIAGAIKARKKLITAGKTQLSKFSWSAAARETLKVYQSVL